MLTIDNLKKSFADDQKSKAEKNKRVHAINDVSINVNEGEFFTLLGPSGCGKTTTLRTVAGLEDPDSGRITVGGRTLFEVGQKRINVPANRRGLGMVFQSYAIWPHMSVFENAAFPLRVAPRSSAGRKDLKNQVMKVLETMELAHLADRRATKLSGGQQQRLALARAIVMEPPLLLLDEPLSNLDAKLRESLRFEIKRLQYELGITTLYVTHDQNEALAMSTTIAVMNAGSIAQLGTPREIYETPQTTFVAEFIGASNLLQGTVTSVQGGDVEVKTQIGIFASSRTGGHRAGDAVRVSIRPETLTLVENQEPTAHNRIAGEVVTSSYVGDSVITVVRSGDALLRVRSKPTLNPDPGAIVSLSVQPADVAVLAESL
jgi:iron(III) transport system ATP-binding protein